MNITHSTDCLYVMSLPCYSEVARHGHIPAGLGLSYEHERLPKRIWLILLYSTETYVINFK